MQKLVSALACTKDIPLAAPNVIHKSLVCSSQVGLLLGLDKPIALQEEVGESWAVHTCEYIKNIKRWKLNKMKKSRKEGKKYENKDRYEEKKNREKTEKKHERKRRNSVEDR